MITRLLDMAEIQVDIRLRRDLATQTKDADYDSEVKQGREKKHRENVPHRKSKSSMRCTGLCL